MVQAMADFRAKLLALLPIAFEAGIFILLGDKKLAEALIPHLFPVEIFGALITIDLFFYELCSINHLSDGFGVMGLY